MAQRIVCAYGWVERGLFVRMYRSLDTSASCARKSSRIVSRLLQCADELPVSGGANNDASTRISTPARGQIERAGTPRPRAIARPHSVSIRLRPGRGPDASGLGDWHLATRGVKALSHPKWASHLNHIINEIRYIVVPEEVIWRGVCGELSGKEAI